MLTKSGLHLNQPPITEVLQFFCLINRTLANTTKWPKPFVDNIKLLLKNKDAVVDELYDVMDWLFERQNAIEKKLAASHLSDDSSVLYDVSSCYYEGKPCSLVQYGHCRDKKKGLPIIVYGILTDNVFKLLKLYP